MKTSVPFLFLALLLSTVGVRAGGVAVGSSDLIGTLQYSDTFTIGSDATTGTRNGDTYPVGDYPLDQPSHPDVANVENNHGNTARSWSSGAFSINNDNNFVDATTNPGTFFQTYPGNSGAGSHTGFTQTGLAPDGSSSPSGIPYETDFGIAYGLSNNFVVQADAVQLSDRIDINIGNTNNTIGSSDGLSIFIRGTSNGASIGLWNKGLEETITGFTSTATSNAWNNYAVDFDLTDKLISVYTNETLLGTINLATFDGGAYAAVLDSSSNAYVGVGGHEGGGDGTDIGLLWTDNFEVGTAAPEPTTWAMLMAGLGLLVGIGRLRRLTV